MKKILSVILCFLFVFALFVPVASAADTPISFDETSVEDDLKTIYADPAATFPADPDDDGIYIVNLTEYGFGELAGMSADNFGLYLYLYNPSGKSIFGAVDKVQFATLWSYDERGNLKATDYKKYNLTKLDANESNTLIKFKVVNPDKSLMLKDNSKGTRRYDISGIEIAHAQYDVEEYMVGYSYIFSGYMKGCSSESKNKSTLHCQRDSLLTLELKPVQVSYLTGDSKKGAGYSNQVNSVYFSVPKDIEKKYGNLYDIKYEYYHYFLNPIIVTDNEEAHQTLMADRGKIVDTENWSYALIGEYDELYPDPESETVSVLFSYGKKQKNKYGYYFAYGGCDYLDCLTTVFLNAELDPDSEGKILVTASELQKYCQNYTLSYHTGKVLNKYSADLFDLDRSDGYYCNTVNLGDSFSLESYQDTHNNLQGKLDYGFFYTAESHDASILDAKYIEEVTLNNLASPDFEKTMLIQEHYKDALLDDCQDAWLNDEKVYVLRYAARDDYYSLDLDGYGISGDFLMAEGSAYLDFDIIQMTFKDSEGVSTIIPVSSAPTDGFPDIIDTTPNRDTLNEWWENATKDLSELLKVFKWIILILAVIAIVVLCFIFIRPLNDALKSLFEKDDKPRPTRQSKKKNKIIVKVKMQPNKKSHSGNSRKRSSGRRKDKR